MAEPLSSERLEWIRRCNRTDKANHGALWEDHGEPAERHRDELLAEVDRLRRGMRDLYARWIQRAIDNGDYYNRTAEKYENGKALAFDAAAEEIRSLIGEEVPADV